MFHVPRATNPRSRSPHNCLVFQYVICKIMPASCWLVQNLNQNLTIFSRRHCLFLVQFFILLLLKCCGQSLGSRRAIDCEWQTVLVEALIDDLVTLLNACMAAFGGLDVAPVRHLIQPATEPLHWSTVCVCVCVCVFVCVCLCVCVSVCVWALNPLFRCVCEVWPL